MRLTRRSGILASLVTLTLLVGLFAVPAKTQAQSVTMSIIPSSAIQDPDLTIHLTLAGFASGETVTIWQTFPDYTVLPRGDWEVSSAGVGEVPIEMGGDIPVGVHYFSVRGNKSGNIVIAPFELLAAKISPSKGVSVEVAGGMGGEQGNTFSFSGRGYKDTETVSIWLTYPDGRVVDLGMERASGGAWEAGFTFTEKHPEGQYHLTGYGNSSGWTGIATFYVLRGDFTNEAGWAQLMASPNRTRQLDVVDLDGSGFLPGERVSLWLTQPDGVVQWIGQVRAVHGGFNLSGYLPAVIPDHGLPVGVHTFSAYGESSKLLATADVMLFAGSGF